MQSNDEQFLWVEKYRPGNINDIILPKALKAQFQQYVEQQEIPNLLFSGTAGIGKTTVAKVLVKAVSADYIMVNGSLTRGIDAIRNDIAGFASTVSFSGGRKYVILDEADNLTHDAQKSLRAFMEEYAKATGFIFTCNYLNKILPALHSRTAVYDFSVSKKEASKLAASFFKRVCEILDNEKVTYDQKSVASLVQRYYPDWRRCLNELQRYSAGGAIDSGVLSLGGPTSIDALLSFIVDKNFTEARHWVKENLDNDPSALLRAFYDVSADRVPPSDVPILVTLVAKYQYQAAFSADPEVNFMAFIADVMINGIEFK